MTRIDAIREIINNRGLQLPHLAHSLAVVACPEDENWKGCLRQVGCKQCWEQYLLGTVPAIKEVNRK